MNQKKKPGRQKILSQNTLHNPDKYDNDYIPEEESFYDNDNWEFDDEDNEYEEYENNYK